jgi:glucose-1-phosphate adenylyltransferase
MAIDEKLATQGVIIGGGQGSRLYTLTRYRGKPAVATNGNLRIIDFVMNNVGDTPEISDLLILTQYQKTSLDNHLSGGSIWGLGDDRKLTIYSPSEEGREVDGVPPIIKRFSGTADAVRKSLPRINSKGLPQVLILGGDHAYRTDYTELLQQHNGLAADLTIMTNVVPEEKISSLGIVRIDENKRVIDFYEKPETPDLVEDFKLDTENSNWLWS